MESAPHKTAPTKGATQQGNMLSGLIYAAQDMQSPFVHGVIPAYDTTKAYPLVDTAALAPAPDSDQNPVVATILASSTDEYCANPGTGLVLASTTVSITPSNAKEPLHPEGLLNAVYTEEACTTTRGAYPTHVGADMGAMHVVGTACPCEGHHEDVPSVQQILSVNGVEMRSSRCNVNRGTRIVPKPFAGRINADGVMYAKTALAEREALYKAVIDAYGHVVAAMAPVSPYEDPAKHPAGFTCFPVTDGAIKSYSLSCDECPFVRARQEIAARTPPEVAQALNAYWANPSDADAAATARAALRAANVPRRAADQAVGVRGTGWMVPVPAHPLPAHVCSGHIYPVPPRKNGDKNAKRFALLFHAPNHAAGLCRTIQPLTTVFSREEFSELPNNEFTKALYRGVDENGRAVTCGALALPMHKKRKERARALATAALSGQPRLSAKDVALLGDPEHVAMYASVAATYEVRTTRREKTNGSKPRARRAVGKGRKARVSVGVPVHRMKKRPVPTRMRAGMDPADILRSHSPPIPMDISRIVSR